MNRIKFLTLTILASVALAPLTFAPASAQSTFKRVYLASDGNDQILGVDNNCDDPGSPCKTLDHAYGKVDAGGDIVITNSGDYDSNGRTISQAVNILAPEGIYAGVRASSGNPAITVAAGSTDVVVLRGLTIDGSGGGDTGINFNSGGALHVEDCLITGFATHGIYVDTSADAKLFVKDSEVRGEVTYFNSAGIVIYPYSGAFKAYIERTRVENNAHTGIYISDGVKAMIRNCTVSGSANGIFLEPASAACEVTVDKTQVVNNTVGIKSDGSIAGSKTRVTNSTVLRNTTGLSRPNSGTLQTRADGSGGSKTNTLEGNGTAGTFSGNFTVQ